MKYVCTVCGWEYDESVGYPEGGIAPRRTGSDAALWVTYALVVFPAANAAYILHCASSFLRYLPLS